MRTPLQILVIRNRDDHKTDMYADTLRLAFEGSVETSGSPSTYLDDAVDLGIRVLEPVEGIATKEVERLLTGARHTIVVAIVSQYNNLIDLLEKNLGINNVVRVVAPSPQSNSEIQGQKPSDGIEPALAPVIATLRVMDKARQILSKDIRDSQNNLSLFISHAKSDGAAIANSLIAMLKQLRESESEKLGFDYFYDHEHIKPGDMWREVLDTQARHSVLIALRTEDYESRYWCRREFLLAEQSGMPIIVVDLRKVQYHDCALLPFNSAPTLRVHDGNIFRIILHAMAVNLRALRVQTSVPNVRVLPHRPSVYSLEGASQTKYAEDTRKIAYPGPKLPEAYISAVAPILAQGERTMELVTFDDLEVE